MLIGITGLQSSGKDTIADCIRDIDPTYIKLSFADTLKDVCSVMFGMDRKMLAGLTPKDRAMREQPDEYWSTAFGKPITPRLILQMFGTDICREHLHPDIWVLCLFKKISNFNMRNIVISDVRFPNEIDAIRKMGGAIIRVERTPLPAWYTEYKRSLQKEFELNQLGLNHTLLAQANAQHPSEREWIGIDSPDVIIHNDSTIDVLFDKVKLEYSKLIGTSV